MKIIILVIFFQLVCYNLTFSQQEQLTYIDKLEAIEKFSLKICSDIPLYSSSSSSGLSAKGKTELNALLKKFGNISIDVEYNNSSSESYGIMQKDLSSVLQKNMDCKENIAKVLINKLMN